MTTSSTKSANVSLKPIEVPKALQEGEKFIKWDEVTFIIYKHKYVLKEFVRSF